jgi:hypothetical protein
VPQGAGHSQ